MLPDSWLFAAGFGTDPCSRVIVSSACLLGILPLFLRRSHKYCDSLHSDRILASILNRAERGLINPRIMQNNV